MRLQLRKTTAAERYGQESIDWKSFDGEEVHIDFMDFGKEGAERTSYFRVTLTFQDIESILNTLAEQNNDGALRIKKALRLADAVNDLAGAHIDP
jgi:hypothetical protein